MATLRPPSSPSPSPLNTENGRSSASVRSSMGPRQTLSPASPRPGGGSGARPTSELLGSNTMFQTPEAEAIDQWFENLQNYEDTLEDMAAASMDANFKEELSAIEQWFKVLSEAERTAALYSLLQQSTQVQIRFFITVLQQMARSDPMTALLSPAVGGKPLDDYSRDGYLCCLFAGSMQSQMEAKLAQMSLKSPSLKSPMAGSPRVFSGNANRQSLALDTSSSFLSPDSAALGTGNDAAATLAQQRAKLKASNAAHRISAPILASGGGDGRTSWGSALTQVAEQNPNSPAQEILVPSVGNSARPKSTEFSGSLGTPRTGMDALSPMVGDSWASNVNTPLIPMFGKETQSHGSQNLDAAAAKLNDWNGGAPRVPLMADPKSFRRVSKGNTAINGPEPNAPSNSGVYDNDGNLVSQQQQQPAQRRNVSQGNGNNAQFSGGQPQGPWNGARSPALPAQNRFGGDEANSPLSGLGMGGFNMAGLGSPGLGMGMPSAGLLAGMNPMQMNMLNLQAQMNAMGMTPEAQILAAQMAAGFTQPNWLSLQQAAMQGANNNNNRNRGGGGRSPGLPKTGSSGPNSATGSGAKKDEEDVDPALLSDIPAWLRSLRLHKYTPNFEKMKWQDMVMLDEAGLEAKGVAALGARRKMLKTFEVVRKKMGIEGPAGSVTSEGSRD
ncbi:hypothetical protein BV22DRAFT_1104307 [Leucogyrophana mollusca]|uniref:Uncharacterized protein n=1 Tax=Leucogyrophana mollusca TaxID=85980 RepID=A0ACB8BKS7_9AGAM|nr:hypothetical protein BV22DRAFT_1104307 [Leucogyrophana mollusca]